MKFVNDLEGVAKTKQGRLVIDSKLRLLSPQNQPLLDGKIFALGDCAEDLQKPLPMLAQVASQQAIYLAKVLN